MPQNEGVAMCSHTASRCSDLQEADLAALNVFPAFLKLESWDGVAKLHGLWSPLWEGSMCDNLGLEHLGSYKLQ